MELKIFNFNDDNIKENTLYPMQYWILKDDQTPALE